MRIGVVGNPAYPQLPAILHQLAREAARRELALHTEPELAGVWERPLPPIDGSPLDAMVTFGGDGTLLRGARLVAGTGTPVLGVNLGRLGFLTTAGRDTVDEALEALVRGGYRTEARLALTAAIVGRDGRVASTHYALNDVVVHNAGVARMARLDVEIDGEPLGPYSADGLVVATPTGSTAYSLSAGGPIVLPTVEAILVTPICAHTLAVRPVVIAATSRVVVVPVAGWSDEMIVSFDGQVGTALADGARVEVRRADEPVRLVRLDGQGFFGRMREKLQWGDLSDREPTT
jgi:NAD+ kinase